MLYYIYLFYCKKLYNCCLFEPLNGYNKILLFIHNFIIWVMIINSLPWEFSFSAFWREDNIKRGQLQHALHSGDWEARKTEGGRLHVKVNNDIHRKRCICVLTAAGAGDPSPRPCVFISTHCKHAWKCTIYIIRK